MMRKCKSGQMAPFAPAGRKKAQSSADWLLSFLILLACILLLAQSAKSTAAILSSSASSLDSAVRLSGAAFFVHSSMFAQPEQISTMENFTASGACLSIYSLPSCQAMARGMYSDWGIIRYEGVGNDGPI